MARWTPLALGCLAAAALLLETTAAWGSGGVHRRTGDGYTVQVDTRWADGGGYHPVRVSITPLQATGEHTFTVRITVRTYEDYWQPPRTTSVTQNIDLPAHTGNQAALPTTATISVPQLGSWASYSIDIWEDGEYRPRLSLLNVPVPNAIGGTYYYGGGAESIATLMVIEPAPSGVATTSMNLTQIAANAGNAQMYGFSLPPEELSDRWIDYTSVDIVCLRQSDLLSLVQARPARWNALRQWVSAGGNLWVYDLGDSMPQLAEIEQALGYLPADSADQKPTDRGWGQVRRNEDWWQQAQGGVVYGPGGMVKPQPVTPPPLNPQTTPQGKFLPAVFRRPLGLGEVMVIGAAHHPTRSGNVVWGEVFAAAGTHRTLWSTRHGLSLYRNNDDYWDFLIPGVGLVPVTTFQVLITLFVLAIGPANYYLLRRFGRLHLLIVSAPVFAVLVTLGLFGYALVSDGFSIRVRARTFTRIDQTRGEAATWSRLSYYAGLAPSDGLRFPKDVAVLPLDPAIGRGGETSSYREVAWGDSQQLTSGWLGSRRLTQFVTVRARKTNYSLKVQESSGGQPPTVENNLRTAVSQLLLSDSQGQVFFGENIKPGEKVLLQPDTPQRSKRLDMHQVLLANRPMRPQEIDTSAMQSSRWMWGWGGLGAPSQATGCLELALDQVEAHLIGQTPLPKRSYVAMVSRSPEVDFGLESAEEDSSFHVILGHW
jgi:hypothetical protein